jgi:hypothetical protein
MEVTVTLNDIGLLLDLLGAGLLFFFGIAPNLSREGTMALSAGESDFVKRRARLFDALGKLGLALIFVGFLGQLLSNHLKIEFMINILFLWAVAATLVLTGILGSQYLRGRVRRVEFLARYAPQYDNGTGNLTGDHLWEFEIQNNTKKHVDADVCPKDQIRRAQFRIPGEPIETVMKVRRIPIRRLPPGASVTVAVWGMGGHITDGQDTYLAIGEGIVRPRVIPQL